MLIREPRAVVFDLDGTLVDVRDDYIVPCIGKTLERLGAIKDHRGQADYVHFARMFWKGFGHRGVLIKEKYGLDPTEFWGVFKTIDSPKERVRHSFAYQDCHILRDIKRKGVRLGIVTDAPESVAELELSLLPIDFDYVVCANELGGIPGKPNPFGLLNCLDNLEVSSDQSIYIGNADVDINVAKNANVCGGIVVRESEYSCVQRPDFLVQNLVEFRDRLFH